MALLLYTKGGWFTFLQDICAAPVPLVVLTVRVIFMCWKSARSHALGLHKYLSIVIDSLACGWTLLHDDYVRTQHLCVSISVKLAGSGFYRWWDSSLGSAEPPENPFGCKN